MNYRRASIVVARTVYGLPTNLEVSVTIGLRFPELTPKMFKHAYPYMFVLGCRADVVGSRMVHGLPTHLLITCVVGLRTSCCRVSPHVL